MIRGCTTAGTPLLQSCIELVLLIDVKASPLEQQGPKPLQWAPASCLHHPEKMAEWHGLHALREGSNVEIGFDDFHISMTGAHPSRAELPQPVTIGEGR